MEDDKTQPIAAGAVADPISESAEVPNYEPQAMFIRDEPATELQPIASSGTMAAHATAIRTSPC